MPKTQMDGYLTPAELAAKLGWKSSDRITDLIRKKELRAFNISRGKRASYVIDPRDWDDYLQKRETIPRELRAVTRKPKKDFLK